MSDPCRYCYNSRNRITYINILIRREFPVPCSKLQCLVPLSIVPTKGTVLLTSQFWLCPGLSCCPLFTSTVSDCCGYFYNSRNCITYFNILVRREFPVQCSPLQCLIPLSIVLTEGTALLTSGFWLCPGLSCCPLFTSTVSDPCRYCYIRGNHITYINILVR